MGLDQELDAVLLQQGLALLQICTVLIELLPVGAVGIVGSHGATDGLAADGGSGGDGVLHLFGSALQSGSQVADGEACFIAQSLDLLALVHDVVHVQGGVVVGPVAEGELLLLGHIGKHGLQGRLALGLVHAPLDALVAHLLQDSNGLGQIEFGQGHGINSKLHDSISFVFGGWLYYNAPAPERKVKKHGPFW